MRDTLTAGELAGRLDGKANGSGWVARCPAHEDGRASLSVGEGEDGRVLLHCHAGCGLDSVLTKLNLTERDLFSPREATMPGRPKIVSSYDYANEDGALLYQVVRYDPKDFRQRRPDGAGWTWKLDGVRRVIYRLPHVLKTAKAGGVVYIVEGEKDAMALEALGLTATTNAGGAGKWRTEYAEALKGCKGVVILPDNDEAGRKHAEDVARSVHAVGVPVKVLRLPGLPVKGDVSDWLASGTKEALANLVKVAPRWEPGPGVVGKPSASVLVRLDTVKVERVSWLWPGRTPYGKVTVLDGDPGKGKSAVSVDLGARLTVGHSMPGEAHGQEPAGVVIMTAEDGLADTVKPRLEAAGGDPSQVVALDAIKLDNGACRMPTLADIDSIREAIVSVSAKLVIIDPIMAYLGSKDGHKDQDVRSIAHPVAHLAEETGVAVVLIRHLNKSEKANPLYRGGGSIGIAGAARSVLLVAPDRNDPDLRILASIKSNLSAPPASLSYRLVSDGDVVRVQWEGVVDVTAAALLASQGTDDDAGGLAGAEAFLEELLAEGPAPSKDVFAQARQAGVSDITLKRAKAALGVKAHKAGGRFGGDPAWYWELPRTAARTAEGDHLSLKGITREHDPLQAQMIPFRDASPPEPDPAPATPETEAPTTTTELEPEVNPGPGVVL